MFEGFFGCKVEYRRRGGVRVQPPAHGARWGWGRKPFFVAQVRTCTLFLRPTKWPPPSQASNGRIPAHELYRYVMLAHSISILTCSRSLRKVFSEQYGWDKETFFGEGR